MPNLPTCVQCHGQTLGNLNVQERSARCMREESALDKEFRGQGQEASGCGRSIHSPSFAKLVEGLAGLHQQQPLLHQFYLVQQGFYRLRQGANCNAEMPDLAGLLSDDLL